MSGKNTPSGKAVTIASGEVTLSCRENVLNTEGRAATDSLDTIKLAGGPTEDGHRINLKTVSMTRVITLTENGNIRFKGSPPPVLDDSRVSVGLEWDSDNEVWDCSATLEADDSEEHRDHG